MLVSSHPQNFVPLTRVMKILMALYWHWAWCSQPMLFYDGLSPIAEPLRLPSVPPAYPSDCFPSGPRDCVAPVPCSYPTPAPSAMQGHKSGVQQCRHSPPPRPDPRAVRACSCKPSPPAPDTRLGAQKNHKIFHSANSGGKFQPNATHERHKT